MDNKSEVKNAEAPSSSVPPSENKQTDHRYCAVKPRISSAFDVDPRRANLIDRTNAIWGNGTNVHYWFGEGPENQKKVVREAFKGWMNIGISIVFTEVQTVDDAEIRIGFVPNIGSWSYIGKDCLTIPKGESTMNFGWDISQEIDTALHEIGHSLGFPHEHQNPFAGIVWNEEAVYESLGGYPNYWPREVTYSNIIQKIDPLTVKGSAWDPDSIMHYPFGAGMIIKPPQYSNGLKPAGGLSKLDIKTALETYPKTNTPTPPNPSPPNPSPPSPTDTLELEPFQSQELKISEGQSIEFTINPKNTQKCTIMTLGSIDVNVVLFQATPQGRRYITSDDNSGIANNAMIPNIRLFAGQSYVLTIRMIAKYYSGRGVVILSYE